MTRPAAPVAKVAGTHFAPAEEDACWRAIAADLARPCRQRVGQGADHRTCKAPSILAINRLRSRFDGRPAADSWWHYCARHAFGRWVEDGKVFYWRLTDDEVPE